MANLNGKVGIVTGGGSGIGKATALAMAKAGAALVIGNREAAKGDEVVALIRQSGGRAVFQKTDVSQPGDVKALVERLEMWRLPARPEQDFPTAERRQAFTLDPGRTVPLGRTQKRIALHSRVQGVESRSNRRLNAGFR